MVLLRKPILQKLNLGLNGKELNLDGEKLYLHPATAQATMATRAW